MIRDAKEIFKKLTRAEKRILLQDLVQKKIEILVKGEEDVLSYMYVIDCPHPHIMECKLTENSERLRINQAVILNFTVNQERYFSQAYLILHKNNYHIETTQDFFQLQRRKSARISLPEEFPKVVKVLSVQDVPMQAPCDMLNFSTGGAKLYYPSDDPAFLVGFSIRVSFQLGKKFPTEINGEVRHMFSKEISQIKMGQVFGMQFTGLTSALQTRLTLIFMDTQREIFLKYS